VGAFVGAFLREAEDVEADAEVAGEAQADALTGAVGPGAPVAAVEALELVLFEEGAELAGEADGELAGEGLGEAGGEVGVVADAGAAGVARVEGLQGGGQDGGGELAREAGDGRGGGAAAEQGAAEDEAQARGELGLSGRRGRRRRSVGGRRGPGPAVADRCRGSCRASARRTPWVEIWWPSSVQTFHRRVSLSLSASIQAAAEMSSRGARRR
jgi:hypothetical protein